MRKLIGFCSLTVLLACGTLVSAQSSFDLEPPVQANPNSSQVIMSPDPDAIPVFKFATAELDGEGNITIATRRSKQKLVAPMATPVSAELDPKGIRFTENVVQNYTVQVPYTETDGEGNVTTKMRVETRTRTVPVRRYRKRNEEEQSEFEQAVAEHEAKLKSEENEKGKVEPAVPTPVAQEYQVQVPYTVMVDGVPKTETRAETRTRTVMVMRGKTETTSTVETNSVSLEKVRVFGVDGTELDEATIKERLSERKPVVMLNSAKAVSFEYFESLLNSDAVFLVVSK